jgi:hypothetical protein
VAVGVTRERARATLRVVNATRTCAKCARRVSLRTKLRRVAATVSILICNSTIRSMCCWADQLCMDGAHL